MLQTIFGVSPKIAEPSSDGHLVCPQQVHWAKRTPPLAATDHAEAVTSSADGLKLVVVGAQGGVFTSTNGGVKWVSRAVTKNQWIDCASSANGASLVLVSSASGSLFQSPGHIYTSANSGATWTHRTNAPITYWQCVASSADGKKLVAGEKGVLNTGGR